MKDMAQPLCTQVSKQRQVSETAEWQDLALVIVLCMKLYEYVSV